MNESNIKPLPDIIERQQQPPKCYLLSYNPKKSTNLGPVLRCASAFGVYQIVLVGYAKCATAGAHGADKHVSIIAYPTFDQAVSYLKSDEVGEHDFGGGGCSSIIGILNGCSSSEVVVYNENGLHVYQDTKRNCILPINPLGIGYDEEDSFSSIFPDPMQRLSYPIHARNFTSGQNICFLFSTLGPGIPIDQAKYCDSFVHVPHLAIISPTSCAMDNHGDSGDQAALHVATTSTAFPRLLDVQTCISIVLHHFTSYAGYNERTFEGHKFHVNQRNRGRTSTGDNDDKQVESDLRLRIAERRKKLKCASDAESHGTLEEVGEFFGDMFSTEGPD